MSVKIGIISDIHATPEPLAEAFSIFREEGVERILCAGDIAGYGTELEQTVRLLMESDCATILGNHDVWFLDSPAAKSKKRVDQFLYQLPAVWESTIEGKHVYAVHGSPPQSLTRGITLLDQNENIMVNEKEWWADQLKGYNFDVLVVGHTHQVFVEKLGNKLVINPGSTVFNHSCAVLSLPDMVVSIFSLSGKAPLKVWNWGMMTRA